MYASGTEIANRLKSLIASTFMTESCTGKLIDIRKKHSSDVETESDMLICEEGVKFLINLLIEMMNDKKKLDKLFLISDGYLLFLLHKALWESVQNLNAKDSSIRFTNPKSDKEFLRRYALFEVYDPL